MPALGVFTDENGKVVKAQFPEENGVWDFDEDDYLLYALICDPIYCAELLGEDPNNHAYAGMFVVRDYQYPLFRTDDNYAGYTCARSVGKTESIKWRSVSHVFRRLGENLLLTAPELIHLLPLTDAIEGILRSVRLTREFLDVRGQKTGFTHRPFGADFLDGTKIVGRIPRLTGQGVKGQHQPDLIVDEGQDYPEKGWVEVHELICLDEPVATPAGWSTMGQLQRGDRVFARSGAAVDVVGLSPVQSRPTYDVVLDDGERVRTDGSHRWTVTCGRYLLGLNGDGDTKWLTKTTDEIAADLAKPGKAFGSPGQPWQLPDVGPVRRPPRDLPIDPYTLGVLIGDGSLTHTLGISVPPHKEPVRERCILPAGDRFSVHKTAAGACPDYGIVGGATKRILGQLGALTKSVAKHIPPAYLLGSVEQRLELLRGLCDTDGNVHRSGAIRFATSSPALRDDVCELVRSLGGRLSVGDVPNSARNAAHHDGWLIFFRLPSGLIPVSRPDMVASVRPARNDKLRRRIVAVEPTGIQEDVRCLMVDDPEHLFLVGRSYVPTRNTVLKDHVDADGNPDFTYHFYGVHSGSRDSGFHQRAQQGGFKIVQITALQRPGWSAQEKEAAKAAYGGSTASDYRRNILGEPGAAASAFFVTSRLVACMDQDRESEYNIYGYKHQIIRVEEFEENGLPIHEVIDLPAGISNVWCGMDIGLTNSPTVITIWALVKWKGVPRLKLVRRIHLERMRTRTIREACYAIGAFYGYDLKGFGMDITGLGFPMWQEMEDDEACPPIMRPAHEGGVARGYFFNAKVPVGVDRNHVSTDGQGRMRDMLGSQVIKEVDPNTGGERYITYMPMIEASTRYLREMVDTTLMLLPFDTEITADMQMETQQRVNRVAGLKNKPNALHILDSMRAMAMAYRAEEVEAELSYDTQRPVLDQAG